MSVESSVSKVAFTGNNSTVTPYNVPFRVDNATDLVVVARLTDTGVETTLAGGQFTVSGLGNPAGCTVTTAAAWPNTYTLTFYREVPATQLTTYASNDSFPASSHERALDKLTYLVQQALRKLGQCFRVTEASTTPTEKPSIPLSVLGLDGSGQLVFRSSQEMVSFLSLTAPLVDNPVATWADPSERALKVPDFLGQLGLERSTLKIYHSTGVLAGNWVASQADPSDLSVTTAKILTQAVTNGKLAHMASSRLKGRSTAGTGDVEDITISQALDFVTRGAQSSQNLKWTSVGGFFFKENFVPKYEFSIVTPLTFTTVIPFDDTPPLITEGTDVLTLSTFTVEKQALDVGFPKILLNVTLTCVASAVSTVVVSLFRFTPQNGHELVYAFPVSATAINHRLQISFSFFDNLTTLTPAWTTGSRSMSYSLRMGSTTGSLTVGGVSGNLLGNTQVPTISAQIYQA